MFILTIAVRPVIHACIRDARAIKSKEVDLPTLEGKKSGDFSTRS